MLYASLSLVALPILLASQASAHGFPKAITVEGKTFQSSIPNKVKGDGVMRAINSPAPVTDLNSPELACGRGASVPVKNFVQAKPGDQVDITWTNSNDNGAFPHGDGPLMQYMALCKTNDCSDDPTKLKFFKIKENGRPNGTFVAKELTQNKPYSFKLHQGLANGKYIMRHELIRLEQNPEVYPSCFNVEITGAKTNAAQMIAQIPAQDLVSFPGAYKKGDPTLTGFDPKAKNIKFPGPKVAAVVKGVQPKPKRAHARDFSTEVEDDDEDEETTELEARHVVEEDEDVEDADELEERHFEEDDEEVEEEQDLEERHDDFEEVEEVEDDLE